MIKLLAIEPIDASHYAVEVDRDGERSRYEFIVSRPEPGDIPVVAIDTTASTYLALEVYEIEAPPGRSGGVIVNPVIARLCQLVRAVDDGDEPILPIVLHD